MEFKLDKYDTKILGILDYNSRESITQIAKNVRLPKETVNYRINRLKKKGIIKSFNLVINSSVLGFRYYQIFLKFGKINLEIEREIIIFLRNKNNCSNLRLTEGGFDMVFLVMFKNITELESFIEDLTNMFGKYIAKKSFHIIVRSYLFHNKIFGNLDMSRHTLEHANRGDILFDKTDKLLLEKLLKEPRAKITEISKNTGVMPKVLSYHLKKLENKDIIVAYSTTINIDRFDLEIIQINISLAKHSMVNNMIEFFMTKSNCIVAYSLIGEFDLSVEIYIGGNTELRIMLDDFKMNFKDGYSYYEVLRIFRDYDTNWSPFEEEVLTKPK